MSKRGMTLSFLVLLIFTLTNVAEAAKVHQDVSAEEALRQAKAAESEPGDWNSDAIRWFLLAAEKGSAEAQWELARYYDDKQTGDLLENNKDGYRTDHAEYWRWLKAAADQGHPAAARMWGQIQALNAKKNIAGAVASKAEAAGPKATPTLVIKVLSETNPDGTVIMTKASEAPIDEAATTPTPELKKAEEGSDTSDSYSSQESQASGQNEVETAIGKGDYYADPQGDHFDGALARQWYQSAADQGSAEAALKLGDLYDADCGGFSDPSEDESNCRQALQWYKKAAQGGNARAQEQVQHYQEAGWR